MGVDRGERLILHRRVDPQAELGKHRRRAVLIDAEHAMLGDVALPGGIGTAVVELLAEPRHVIHVFHQKMPAAAGRIETAEFPRLPLGLERQRLLDALLDQIFRDRFGRVETPLLAPRVAAGLRIEPPLLDLDDVSQELLVDVPQDAGIDLRVVDRSPDRLAGKPLQQAGRTGRRRSSASDRPRSDRDRTARRRRDRCRTASCARPSNQAKYCCT